MKLKRFLSAFLSMCMLASVFMSIPVRAAAQEWTYILKVQISDARDSKSKNGNIKARLYFNGKSDDELFVVSNTKKTGKMSETTYTSSRAPWTLDYLQMENYSKDGFKMLHISLGVAKKGNSNYKWLLDKYYPRGTGSKDGHWIQTNDGDKPTYCITLWPEKDVKSAGNIDSFGGMVYMGIAGERGKLSYEYNGQVDDQYKDMINDGKAYYCMDMSDAPVFTYSASGTKGDGGSVNKNDLVKNGGFADKSSGRGFEIDKAKLSAYMNKNNVNKITVTSKLDFPSSSTNTPRTFEKKLVFVRKAFTVESISLSKNYYVSSTDNNYYNNDIKDKGKQAITVTGTVKTGGNNEHLSSDNLKGTKLYFNKAYLTLGNTGKTLASAEKEAVFSGNTFTLTFPYTEGADSNNGGVELKFDNARIKPNGYGGNEFKIWNEYSKNESFSYLVSTHKVDAVEPTVALEPVKGSKIDEWNKTITLKSTPSETINWSMDIMNIYKVNYDNYYMMQLKNSTGVWVSIYDFKGKGSSAYMQKVPAAEGSSTEITLALKDKIEGSFDLELSGKDKAGNPLKTKLTGILLDNKAPEVGVTEVCDTEPRGDGSRGNTYNVSITDASGTGRMYYCFTTDLKNVPELDKAAAERQSSGTISSLLDRWAYIDQSDVSGGKSAAAYMSVERGKNFDGYLVYFGEDKFGNVTEKVTKKISIINENTDSRINIANDTSIPHPNYNITVETNAQNRVEYRWKDSKGNYLGEYKPYADGINTADDAATSKLDGTYELLCKIIPPSGENNAQVKTKTLVFDNSGPALSARDLNSGAYSETHTISVYGTDASGIKEGYAIIVNPDGSRISGMEETALAVSGDTISQNVNISGIQSGAYALEVRAVDNNGLENKIMSETFFIRNIAPQSEVKPVSSLSHNEKPLLSSGDFSLSFNVSEEFANASAAGKQQLYYRISDSVNSFGDWLSAGEMTVSGNEIKADITAAAPRMEFADGENYMYIQTAICADGAQTGSISVNNVRTSEMSFFYDETAPQSRAVINDVHTSEPITGKVYLTDNLDAELTLTCSDTNVKIEKSSDEGDVNVFNVTVTENTNSSTVLTACDKAGNKSEIPLVINGIDREAPTAEMTITSCNTGERTDGKATVKVNSVREGDVKFAFIPKDEYLSNIAYINQTADGKAEVKISDSCFDNYDSDVIRISQTDTEQAWWEDEKNVTYSISVAGITQDYYIAVRASDSVGNSADIVSDTVISAKDAELTMDYTVAPKKTDERAVVRMNFNVPVYVLPQSEIVYDVDEDYDTVDETNLGKAKENSGMLSQTSSLVISDVGDYKIYTADDIGRTKAFTVQITDSDVEFHALGGLNVVTLVGGTPVADGEMAGLYVWNDNGEYLPTTVEISPAQSGMNLYPVEEKDGTDGMWFDRSASEQYKTSGDAYTKLVYNAYQKMEYVTDDPSATKDPHVTPSGDPVVSEENERVVELKIFEENNTDRDTWGDAIAVIDNIDNTPPSGTVTYTPEIYKLTEYDSGPEIYYTPGNVTVVAEIQDKDSGIERITFGIPKEDGEPEEIVIPMKDSSGNYIDYNENPWTWSGESMNIPVTIDFYGDTNPKSTKVLKYVFTDNYEVRAPICRNGAGDEMMIAPERMESIGTMGAIYKMNIEEGKDYELKYFYEDGTGNWVDMTDDVKDAQKYDALYYKRAKAVIELTDRGTERELAVSNNSRKIEKTLDIYENSFTFELKDKYGYTLRIPVELTNFDEKSGTVDYRLSTTEKTNDKITVTITAEDDQSGVGTVKLMHNNSEIPVTDKGSGIYEGVITENGSYSVVMYDKVGNKAAKNFSVSNIDRNKPALTGVDLSTTELTSKSVSAALKFSKPNVRITSAEPTSGIKDGEYTVDYSNSVIVFTESGTLSVTFKDDYGNIGEDVVTVGNIDRTPPALEAVCEPDPNKTEVAVSFKKAVDTAGAEIDKKHALSDITVIYGGMAQKADKAKYVFYENGTYTIKAYDDEGISSYVTLKITDIDTTAPNITEIRWSYDYDVLENGAWQKKTANEKITPSEAGFVAATDKYPVTNNDVDVTVVTDSETRPVGSTGEYSKENTKTYTDNGMFIFDMEKNNRLTDRYGVDIELIDKVPPVIDLLGRNELIFYENPKVGEAYSKDYLAKPGEAFKAYDKFGKGTDLNDKVEIVDWGGFNPNDITQNVFDSSIPYTITYRVSDNAHNITEARRTVRLVGLYDTIALVNDALPDFAGRSEVMGNTVKISLKNFSGTAYARYQSGVKTMGQMKKSGTMIKRDENGEFKLSGLSEGWYTFYVQTDKRDYFTLQIYVYN